MDYELLMSSVLVSCTPSGSVVQHSMQDGVDRHYSILFAELTAIALSLVQMTRMMSRVWRVHFPLQPSNVEPISCDACAALHPRK